MDGGNTAGAGSTTATAVASTSTARPILINPKIGLTQKGKRKVCDPGQLYQIPLPLPPEFHDPNTVKVISKDNPYTDLPPIGSLGTCTKKGLEHISGKIVECTIQTKILCEFEDEYGKIHTVDFADLELVSDSDDENGAKAKTSGPKTQDPCFICPNDKKKIASRKCDLCKRWTCLLHGKHKYWCKLCELKEGKPYVHNSYEKEEGKTSRAQKGSCYMCLCGPGAGARSKRTKKTTQIHCGGCKRWVCQHHRFSKFLCLGGCDITISKKVEAPKVNTKVEAPEEEK